MFGSLNRTFRSHVGFNKVLIEYFPGIGTTLGCFGMVVEVEYVIPVGFSPIIAAISKRVGVIIPKGTWKVLESECQK